MFASCEKIYEPNLRDKGLIVLSNNDGNSVAVCPIAKALGAPKFQPYFKFKDWAKVNKIVIRSSNYELYGDVSRRVMQSLTPFAPKHYIYSIDEQFLDLFNCKIADWMGYGRLIRRTVWQETKMPVSVGFGKTLTLSKCASHASKRIKVYRGVAAISNEQERQFILSQMKLSDVWGVGKRLSERLKKWGLNNALELANQPPKKIRMEFGVTLERTVRELNNEACLNWDEIREIKKQIFSTRSVGERITSVAILKQALAFHAEVVAEKARKQNSCIKELLVFAATSPFDKSGQFSKTLIHQFVNPTLDSRYIIAAATNLADVIFRHGIRFYRVGVGAVKLAGASPYQSDLFQESKDNVGLMSAIDSINLKFGGGTMAFAAKGIKRPFAMKREMLSKQFTTRWNHLPKINC